MGRRQQVSAHTAMGYRISRFIEFLMYYPVWVTNLAFGRFTVMNVVYYLLFRLLLLDTKEILWAFSTMSVVSIATVICVLLVQLSHVQIV